MTNMNDGVHTTTDPKGTGWVNQANGTVLTRHRKKTRAIAAGRALAKQHATDFTNHRKDGSVIQTRSYGVSPL